MMQIPGNKNRIERMDRHNPILVPVSDPIPTSAFDTTADTAGLAAPSIRRRLTQSGHLARTMWFLVLAKVRGDTTRNERCPIEFIGGINSRPEIASIKFRTAR